MKREVLIVLGLALAVGVGFALLQSGGPAPAPDRPIAAVRSAGSSEGGTPARAQPASHPRPGAKLDKERAKALRAALLAALARAPEAGLSAPEGGRDPDPPAGASPVGGAPPVPAGSLDPSYVRAAVNQITPLIAECYGLARHERPDLGGTLVVEFSIIGDPELGAVLERSEIVAAESTLRHPVLDECMRESMYALELPAPESGGRVVVRFPFKFTSAPKSAPTGGP